MSELSAPQNKRLLTWVCALAALVLLGTFGAGHVFMRHEPPPLEWGSLVPAYVFFALAATGSSLVNSIFTVFGVKAMKPVIKRGVLLSILLIIPSWLFMAFEVGRPLHMWKMGLFFQPDSRIAWMGALYACFATSLLIELAVVIKEDSLPHWVHRLMGWVVLIVTLAVHTNLGALFGVVNAKPLWSSHMLAAHFIVSAVTSGAAIHILFNALLHIGRDGGVPAGILRLFSKVYAPLIAGLVLVNFVMIAEKFFVGSDIGSLLATGSYALSFWGLEIVVGGIVPLVLLLHPATKGSARWLVTAATLLLFGVVVSKYDVIVGGQSATLQPMGVEISYLPELAEIIFFFGGTALALMLYTVAELLLPLDHDAKPQWLWFFKKPAPIAQWLGR